MNKEPYEYNIINTDEINDKLLNHFKTTLYELKEDVVELKLTNEEENDEICLALKSENSELYGNWIIVNGNCIKNDQTHFKENCRKAILV